MTAATASDAAIMIAMLPGHQPRMASSAKSRSASARSLSVYVASPGPGLGADALAAGTREKQRSAPAARSGHPMTPTISAASSSASSPRDEQADVRMFVLAAQSPPP
jgi:hypothetical protein